MCPGTSIRENLDCVERASLLTAASDDRYGTAITIQIITGHEIKSLDDVYLRVAEDVGKAMTGSGTPGATGVDFCPWCKWQSMLAS